MIIEVCDKCQSRWDLVDIPDEKRVLCRECFGKEFQMEPWEVRFNGGLAAFGRFVTWLKERG